MSLKQYQQLRAAAFGTAQPAHRAHPMLAAFVPMEIDRGSFVEHAGCRKSLTIDFAGEKLNVGQPPLRPATACKLFAAAMPWTTKRSLTAQGLLLSMPVKRSSPILALARKHGVKLRVAIDSTDYRRSAFISSLSLSKDGEGFAVSIID